MVDSESFISTWATAFGRDRQQYHSFIENMLEGFAYQKIILDADGRPLDYTFLEVNGAFAKLIGVEKGELLGSRASKIFQDLGEDAASWIDAFGKAAAEGELVRFESFLRHLDRWVLISAYCPERGYLISTAIDITERKKAEDELRKSRDELEDRVKQRTEELSKANEKLLVQAELMDKAYEAITVRDLDGRITYWNKGAERTYGYTAEEVIGRKVKELLFEDSAQYDLAYEVVRTNGEWNGEFRQIAKDGRELIIDAHWTLVSDGDIKPKSIISINTDVTERRSLEAQYLRAQRLESLGTLAGGIAHDFRNILTPIMIALELLDQHLTNEEDHELITMLNKNVQRGSDLSRQLLTFARGTGGERTQVSMASIISEVVKTIKETFPRSIAVEMEVHPDIQAIMGDGTQLHQVLINLCINARDAMPFGGTLWISAENVLIDDCHARTNVEAKVGAYVCTTVTDSGIGMPPEVLEKLFEPFFTTKKPGEGTGLGLSTARSIVKSHGGFITVDSEIGKGSSFKIYLPVADSDGRYGSVQSMSAPRGDGQTVLVVDDEELIRMTASSALENNGYKVITASDGAEALGAYTQHKREVKAVLLDMSMPIMDGEATIRALKKINPEVKIIGMSGLVENGMYETMFSVTSAFLAKPFTAERLLSTLDKVLSNHVRSLA